jgi:hypothetical protein
VLGFYLRLEDMSSPRSETEWINLSTGLSYTPHRRAWGLGRVELGKCGTIPTSRIEGISGREVGLRPLSLSVSPVCPHRGISQFQCCPLCEGAVLRAGCRMGP